MTVVTQVRHIRPRKIPSRLAHVLMVVLVALSYYLAAMLGLSLAIPPGYATALWPPSGIALGVTLIWGNRILPGIFLGSFLTNLTMLLQPTAQDDWALTLGIATGIAIGSVLQAVVTSVAIKRWVGYPNALIKDREVLCFYGLAGPVGCLINATFSLSLLVLLDKVPLDILHRNWLTWWLGDTIGVFIFTPILLALFGRPRGAWRFRRRVLALPLIASFCITSVFFLYSEQFEQRRQESELQALNSTASDYVQSAVVSHLEELYSLQGLFHSTGSVDRNEFARFTVPAIKRNPGIQGFSWNAWVKQTERETFESEQRKNGQSNFEITEKNPAGQFVKAKQHSDYVVVTYIEPFATNAKALGYDVGSEPIRRAAIDQAVTSGHLSSTAPIRLVQETGQQKGILIFLPVFHNPDIAESNRHDPANIAGFVVEVLRIGDVIDTALADLGTKRHLIRIEVRDRDAPTGGDYLYSDATLTAPNAMTLTKTLDVGGRHWELVTTIVGDLPGASLNTLYVLLGGASFTALLGLLLMTLSGRTLGMEGEVRARTAEIYQKNQRLTEEVSHRLEVEGALRESETRFKTMADSAPVLVFTSTADGKRDYFNRQWQCFTGYAHEAERSGEWQTFFHADDLAPYLALRDEATREHQPFNMSYRLRSSTGDYRWFLDSSAPRFGADHSFMGFISSCIDITEIKESQAAMQVAKEAAEHANTVKSVFMANLSHELLTPMNAILGLSHLLLNESLPPDTQSHLEKINLSAQNLLVLLNTLLDFSSLETGKMKIISTEFSLKEILGKLQEQSSHMAQSKNLELVFEEDPGIPEYLMGDSSRLTQILTNLLSNAVKFTERGRIVVQAELEEEAKECLWVKFRISDTGIGIKPEQLEELFTAFNQADGSSTRKYGGTGLGLTVAQRLTGHMGGEIKVESTPGVGSTFTVTLPFQPVEATSAQNASKENAYNFQNKHILLVEDNQLNQLVAKRFLARLEIIAEVAENGQEALDKIATAEQPYDAILMDIQMPIMDGLEATRRLRSRYPKDILPIIAVSANTSDQDRENCVTVGMNDFIPKPLDLAGLTRVLGLWLRVKYRAV